MANEPGGTKFAQLITEIDLDRSKYDKKLDESVEAANLATIKIEKAFKQLGVRTDQSYEQQRIAITTFYKKIIDDANVSANERAAAEQMLARKIEAINSKQYSALNSMRQSQLKAEEDSIKQRDGLWTNMGVRSNAQIEVQKKQVLDSYATLKAGAQGHHYEQLRLEDAKNKQLRKLNDEMVGHTSITWASMTRSLLRFYAAYYVVSSGVSTISNLFMGGVKAIDDLKTNTIAVASIITTMQGTTGNVVENYRMNLVYADALNKKLMEIDANTSANYDQLQLMNRAAISNGVMFDINSQKQIESFTAISNTVAFLTKGQNQEIQYSQEINALMKGEVNSKNRVAQMIDNIIKQEGKYKDGLEEVIKLGKQHGDTWERLLPYFVGINAASSDIAKTWAAVSSSLQTAWGIIQRGLFAGVYDTLTTEGQKATQWMKKNADDIVAVIYKIKDTAIFAIEATMFALGLFSAAVIFHTNRAGDAAAWFALRWEAITTQVTIATSRMALAFSVFVGAILGFSIGSYLSSQFEWARVSGVAMVYGLIDAWEKFKLVTMTAKIGMSFSSAEEQAAAIKKLSESYESEKLKRDQMRDAQFGDVSDSAIARAKAKAEEAGKIKIPVVPPGAEDAEKEKEIRRNKLAEATADNKQYYEDAISKSDHWLRMQKIAGERDVEDTQDNILDKKVALNEWYDRQAKSLKTYLKGDTKLSAELTKLWREYSSSWNKLNNEQIETKARQVETEKKLEEKRLDGYDEGWKKFYELKGKESDLQQKNTETYRKMVADEYDFAATENERQINKIIHDEKEKLHKLKELYDQSQVLVESGKGFMTFAQYEERKKQITSNTGKAISEVNLKVMQDQISYLGNLEGTETRAYDLRQLQIAEEVKKMKSLGSDEATARRYAANETDKAFIKMTRGSENFFQGTRAAFITLQEDAIRWGQVGIAVGATFKASLGTEIGNSIYDMITGKFTGIVPYAAKIGDDVLKSFTKKIGEMAAQEVTDLFKPITNGFDTLMEGSWQLMKDGFKGAMDWIGGLNIFGNGGLLTSAFSSVSDFFANSQKTGVWDTIATGFESAMNLVMEYWDDLAIYLSALFDSDTGSGIFGWLSSLLGYREGTFDMPFDPAHTFSSQYGPDGFAVVAHQGEMIIPANESEAIRTLLSQMGYGENFDSIISALDTQAMRDSFYEGTVTDWAKSAIPGAFKGIMNGDISSLLSILNPANIFSSMFSGGFTQIAKDIFGVDPATANAASFIGMGASSLLGLGSLGAGILVPASIFGTQYMMDLLNLESDSANRDTLRDMYGTIGGNIAYAKYLNDPTDQLDIVSQAAYAYREEPWGQNLDAAFGLYHSAASSWPTYQEGMAWQRAGMATRADFFQNTVGGQAVAGYYADPRIRAKFSADTWEQMIADGMGQYGLAYQDPRAWKPEFTFPQYVSASTDSYLAGQDADYTAFYGTDPTFTVDPSTWLYDGSAMGMHQIPPYVSSSDYWGSVLPPNYYGTGTMPTIIIDPGDFYTPPGYGDLGGMRTGGVASGPDSGYNMKLHGTEAVVPLPNGRSIPVDMGDSGRPMHIHLYMNGKEVAYAVANELDTNPRLKARYN